MWGESGGGKIGEERELTARFLKSGWSLSWSHTQNPVNLSDWLRVRRSATEDDCSVIKSSPVNRKWTYKAWKHDGRCSRPFVEENLWILKYKKSTVNLTSWNSWKVWIKDAVYIRASVQFSSDLYRPSGESGSMKWFKDKYPLCIRTQQTTWSSTTKRKKMNCLYKAYWDFSHGKLINR